MQLCLQTNWLCRDQPVLSPVTAGQTPVITSSWNTPGLCNDAPTSLGKSPTTTFKVSVFAAQEEDYREQIRQILEPLRTFPADLYGLIDFNWFSFSMIPLRPFQNKCVAVTVLTLFPFFFQYTFVGKLSVLLLKGTELVLYLDRTSKFLTMAHSWWNNVSFASWESDKMPPTSLH